MITRVVSQCHWWELLLQVWMSVDYWSRVSWSQSWDGRSEWSSTVTRLECESSWCWHCLRSEWALYHPWTQYSLIAEHFSKSEISVWTSVRRQIQEHNQCLVSHVVLQTLFKSLLIDNWFCWPQKGSWYWSVSDQFSCSSMLQTFSSSDSSSLISSPGIPGVCSLLCLDQY